MSLRLEALEVRDNPSSFTPRVPAELWQQLAADVRVLAEGTVKPSQESVTAFVAAVQSAAADGQITYREYVQVVAAGEAVLASANVPVSEVQAVVADVKAVYAAWVG